MEIKQCIISIQALIKTFKLPNSLIYKIIVKSFFCDILKAKDKH